MNKLDLIERLKADAGLTMNEASAAVKLLFDKKKPLPAATGSKSGGCVPSM